MLSSPISAVSRPASVCPRARQDPHRWSPHAANGCNCNAAISRPSRLCEKLACIHNHWNGLQTFLTDGRVEIDSNFVENLTRSIALNRKNALFAGHDEGGVAWGRIASLIET